MDKRYKEHIELVKRAAQRQINKRKMKNKESTSETLKEKIKRIFKKGGK